MEEKDIIKTKELSTINPQKLAFLGDAVYELIVRYNIVKNFQGNIGELNSIKTKNVCCSAQSDMYEKIKDILTPKENSSLQMGVEMLIQVTLPRKNLLLPIIGLQVWKHCSDIFI